MPVFGQRTTLGSAESYWSLTRPYFLWPNNFNPYPAESSGLVPNLESHKRVKIAQMPATYPLPPNLPYNVPHTVLSAEAGIDATSSGLNSSSGFHSNQESYTTPQANGRRFNAPLATIQAHFGDPSDSFELPQDRKSVPVSAGSQVNPNGSDGSEDNDSDEDDEDVATVPAPSGSAPAATAAVITAPMAGNATGNLNTGKGQLVWDAVEVDCQLPANLVIGAYELCAFLPNHTQWPAAGLRLHRNGCTSNDVIKMQLHARNRVSKANVRFRHQMMRAQVRDNGREFFNIPKFNITTHKNLLTATSNYTTNNWQPRAKMTKTLLGKPLVNLAVGVTNMPTGQDRGLLSQCVEYAVQTGQAHLTTMDIPHIVQQQGFNLPGEAYGALWDQNANSRCQAAIVQAGTFV